MDLGSENDLPRSSILSVIAERWLLSVPRKLEISENVGLSSGST